MKRNQTIRQIDRNHAIVHFHGGTWALFSRTRPAVVYSPRKGFLVNSTDTTTTAITAKFVAKAQPNQHATEEHILDVLERAAY